MSVDGAEPVLPPAVARFGRTKLYSLDQFDSYGDRLVNIEAPDVRSQQEDTDE